MIKWAALLGWVAAIAWLAYHWYFCDVCRRMGPLPQMRPEHRRLLNVEISEGET